MSKRSVTDAACRRIHALCNRALRLRRNRLELECLRMIELCELRAGELDTMFLKANRLAKDMFHAGHAEIEARAHVVAEDVNACRSQLLSIRDALNLALRGQDEPY